MGITRGTTRALTTTCAFLKLYPTTNTEVYTYAHVHIWGVGGHYYSQPLDCPCDPDDKSSVWVGD